MADTQHASSWAGDPTHMPEGYAGSVTSLKANSGLLGQNPGNPTARQDIPGSGDVATHGFRSDGESGFLGQDTDDYRGGNMTDGQRDAPPDPSIAGGSGTKTAGQQGSPLDWNSVAPYKYPEFPKDSGKTAASSTPAPLT